MGLGGSDGKGKRRKRPRDVPLFGLPTKAPQKRETASVARQERAHWLETQLYAADGTPLAYAQCRVLFDDGREFERRSNEFGVLRVDGLSKPGSYRIAFPELADQCGGVDSTEEEDLELLKIDSLFAPGAEDLLFKYRIAGFRGKKVSLEVTSEHYADGPIYKRALTAVEKTTGEWGDYWDGRANCTAGALSDECLINPLYSPYTLRFFSESGLESSKVFHVRYHSLELQGGPWTPDGTEPAAGKEEEWVTYRLNQLGYYAGPVGKDLDNYRGKAIAQYRANHPVLHQPNAAYDDYSQDIDQGLKDALAGDQGATVSYDATLIGAQGGSDVVLNLDSIYYTSLDDFDPQNGRSNYQIESERMNRPLVPLEVVIHLEGKDGSAKSSPEAVGPVTVEWGVYGGVAKWVDGLPTFEQLAPSRTQDYVRSCIEHEYDGSDNCHVDFGGLRDGGQADWQSPFVLGESYLPFVAEENPAKNAVCTNACADAIEYPDRVGRAGILFRPSLMSGDSYTLVATLKFTGLSNADQLSEAHSETDLSVTSCDFTVLRNAKVAVVVEWPGRAALNEKPLPWSQVKKEFLAAGICLDVDNIVSRRIAELITEEEYRDLVTKHTNYKNRDEIRLDPDSLLAVAVASQGQTPGNQYQVDLYEILDEFTTKIRGPLLELLRSRLRPEFPRGFIAVDFAPHPPVNVIQDPNSELGPNNRQLPDYSSPGSSLGLTDASLLIQSLPIQRYPYDLLAHEMGHCFFLKHWRHGDPEYPELHDTSDNNCTMCTTSAACSHGLHGLELTQGHFCGKCNLQLRGWDIENAPEHSPPFASRTVE